MIFASLKYEFSNYFPKFFFKTTIIFTFQNYPTPNSLSLTIQIICFNLNYTAYSFQKILPTIPSFSITFFSLPHFHTHLLFHLCSCFSLTCKSLVCSLDYLLLALSFHWTFPCFVIITPVLVINYFSASSMSPTIYFTFYCVHVLVLRMISSIFKSICWLCCSLSYSLFLMS